MRALLIDDSRFFIKAESVPPELSDSEAAFFASSEAEASAAWSGEAMVSAHMRFGESVLIYAGSRETVFGGYSLEELSRARLVIPASAALLALKPDGVCVLEGPSCVFAAEFSRGRAVRAGAFAVSDSSGAEQARMNAFELAGIDASSPFCVYKLLAAELKNGRVAVSAERHCGGGAEKLEASVAKKFFASAELRGGELLRASRRVFWNRAALRLAALAAALALAGLCAWQVSIWAKAAEVKNLRAHLASIEPAAKIVEKRSAEISKLSNFAGEKVRPIRTLAYLNSLRPDSVSFDSIRQTGVSEAAITGTAPSITDVKAFVDAVNASKKYSAQMTSDSSRGKTRFVVNLTGGGK